MGQDIAVWEPDYLDFLSGHQLLVVEDYSKVVDQRTVDVNNHPHFTALIYSVLTWREKFDSNQAQFHEFLSNGFWTSRDVLENKSDLAELLGEKGFGNKKFDTIYTAAEKWGELDITRRMREDKDKQLGKYLRKLICEEIPYMGPKISSLFVRMSGYQGIVPVDMWAIRYVESRGFRSRHENSGLKYDQYLAYEDRMAEYAGEINITPALFQATIYTAFSTWKKDSGFENL